MTFIGLALMGLIGVRVMLVGGMSMRGMSMEFVVVKNPTMQIMGVVVMMGVDCEFVGMGLAEQGNEFRMLLNMLRCSAATQMAIETDNPVGTCHHDV